MDKLAQHLLALEDMVDGARRGVASHVFLEGLATVWQMAIPLIADPVLRTGVYQLADQDLTLALEAFRSAPSPAGIVRIRKALVLYRRAVLRPLVR